MVDDNYCNFTTTRPNKAFYDPEYPETHRQDREERKKREREGKRLEQSLFFISSSLDIVLDIVQ